MNFITS